VRLGQKNRKDFGGGNVQGKKLAKKTGKKGKRRLKKAGNAGEPSREAVKQKKEHSQWVKITRDPGGGNRTGKGGGVPSPKVKRRRIGLKVGMLPVEGM